MVLPGGAAGPVPLSRPSTLLDGMFDGRNRRAARNTGRNGQILPVPGPAATGFYHEKKGDRPCLAFVRNLIGLRARCGPGSSQEPSCCMGWTRPAIVTVAA